MKIYVRKKTEAAILPISVPKGDWVDLATPYQVKIDRPEITSSRNGEKTKILFDDFLVDFEIAMKLPKGFEAVVLPRSSTYKRYGVLLSNSQGVIDNVYFGNDDTWKALLIGMRNVNIPAGTRICQFRIQLSQKATIWQKLRWLFSNKIEFVEVKDLGNNNRGGFGSTGK